MTNAGRELAGRRATAALRRPSLSREGLREALAQSLHDETSDTYHAMTMTDARDIAGRMVRGVRGKPLLSSPPDPALSEGRLARALHETERPESEFDGPMCLCRERAAVIASRYAALSSPAQEQGAET